jgi:hypothetical protein
MPLDFAGFEYRDETSLQAVALGLGIIPVPAAVLDAHKKAEVAKHPGGVIARYQRPIRNVICVTVLGILAADLIFTMCTVRDVEFNRFLFIQIGVVLALIGLMLPLELRVKGPAEWRSTFTTVLDSDIPVSLRDMADAIRAAKPGCRFEVGQLMQDKVVLDPYLVVHHRGSPDPVVIGIWDGDKIIASATRV